MSVMDIFHNFCLGQIFTTNFVCSNLYWMYACQVQSNIYIYIHVLITVIFIFHACPFLIFHQSLPGWAPVLRSPWWHNSTCPPISLICFMSCFRSLPSLPLLYTSIDLCLSRPFYDKWAFNLIMPTWSLFS